VTITKELIIFLSFILEGIAGGILLDILRVFRHNRKINDFVVYLEDILYWVVLGCGVIWLSYILNTDAIRLYMLFGLFLGMLIYFLTLTKVMYKVFDFICRYLLKLIGWFFKIFKGANNEKESKLA